jgi:hypothetical protein
MVTVGLEFFTRQSAGALLIFSHSDISSDYATTGGDE